MSVLYETDNHQVCSRASRSPRYGRQLQRQGDIVQKRVHLFSFLLRGSCSRLLGFDALKDELVMISGASAPVPVTLCFPRVATLSPCAVQSYRILRGFLLSCVLHDSSNVYVLLDDKTIVFSLPPIYTRFLLKFLYV